MYDNVIKQLPEYKFIFSNQLNLNNNDMYDIYSKCFIGLRLTKYDGNSNTTQEFEAMNIPIIHNQSDYGIKWNNIDDIILNIRYASLNNFNNDIMNKYKRILFICNDYPSYGGAATNTYKLINFYKEKGIKTFGLFTNFENMDNIILPNNDNIIINQGYKNISYTFEKIYKYLNGYPDLIIFRSYWNYKYISKFKCHKILLLPGLFINDLNKKYNTLDKNDIIKYTNNDIINLSKYVNQVYCANIDTINILKDVYNITARHLNFNYIPYINKT